jgi:hypothetical protein
MSNSGGLLIFIFSILVFLRTISYGVWTWNKKSKPGALAVMAIGFVMICIEIYEVFLVK